MTAAIDSLTAAIDSLTAAIDSLTAAIIGLQLEYTQSDNQLTNPTLTVSALKLQEEGQHKHFNISVHGYTEATHAERQQWKQWPSNQIPK